MKLYWNTHHIRPSRHDTVGGIPDVLFQVPEESGAFDCSVPLSRDKILEMESKCANEEDENVFQEYFHYVMEEEGFSIRQTMKKHFVYFLKSQILHDSIKTFEENLQKFTINFSYITGSIHSDCDTQI